MLKHTLLAVALLVGAPAFAQDEDDPFGDELDDILAPEEDSGPGSVREEREMLEEEAEREQEARDEPELPDDDGKKRVIKTLQKKTFLKINRYELSPTVGFVTNDPFINRYLVGFGFTYHVTEIFGLEVSGVFSPDLGRGDWKPITVQIVDENQVTPDISKIEYYGTLSFSFSPIYGKIALAGRKIINFDIFGVFGTGLVNTRDDLEALQKATDPIAINTESQFHPTLNFGGGMRVVFSPAFAMRLEGRGMSYIEVLESTQLEMKNNVMLQVSGSLFIPRMK